MTDPNDSDGSWEFVDKDTDSETSSVASAYDTGLPEDVEEPSRNNEEDLVGSAWNNKDEFVTDSDIEACADDPVESDNEADATVVQAAARLCESEHGGMSDSCRKSEDDASSSTLSKSHDENDLPDLDDDNQPETQVYPDKGLKAGYAQDVSCDDSTEEVMTSQENIDEAQTNDIMQVTGIDDDSQASVEEVEPSPLSNVSSHSDFERIASSSDLATSGSCPEAEDLQISDRATQDATEPKTVEVLHRSDQSDDGSIDFTVIAAPASPPVEITSHQAETTTSATDDDSPLDKIRTVGMVTEIQWAIKEKTDVASGPDEATQKTVGMVTDHQSPPNQRLLISFLMISFGVGFLLGRCPSSSTVLFPFEERYAPIEKTDLEDSPKSIQHIYHGEDQTVDTSFEYADSLLSALSKAHAANDLMRCKLTVENSRLRNRNRRLRSTIGKLKSEHDRIVTKQSTQETTSNDMATTLARVKHTCWKQRRLVEMNLASKQDKVKEIKTQLQETKRENIFLNQTMNLCKRLQQQHSDLVALQKTSDEKHEVEKAQFDERLHGMRLRLRRYRTESKGLIQQLAETKTRNFYLTLLAQQNDVPKEEEIADQGQRLRVVSPFVKAITDQSQTCSSGSKSIAQVKWLRSKLKGQRSAIRKLERENRLKSMALEMLYNSFGELRNFATCLKQQILILPEGRVRDAPAICRPHPADHPSQDKSTVPIHTPQCSFPINGTLSMDFSSINITLETFEDLPSYKLKLSTDKAKPMLTFNSTLLVSSMCDLTFKTNLTSGRSDRLVPKVLYARAVERSNYIRRDLEARTAEFSSLQKVCEANNRSLDVTRKEVANVENQLVVAKNELKRLRKEKKELNKKLYNVTSELKKKSSVKNCLASALNADELLKQVNDSKAFKAASKMAKKVQNAGNKAWNKLKKFVNKFGESGQQDEFEDYDNDEAGSERASQKKREHGSDSSDGNDRKQEKDKKRHGNKERGEKQKSQKHQHRSQTHRGSQDKKERKQDLREDLNTDQRMLRKGKYGRIIPEFNATHDEGQGKPESHHRMRRADKEKAEKEVQGRKHLSKRREDHDNDEDEEVLFGPDNKNDHQDKKPLKHHKTENREPRGKKQSKKGRDEQSFDHTHERNGERHRDHDLHEKKRNRGKEGSEEKFFGQTPVYVERSKHSNKDQEKKHKKDVDGGSERYYFDRRHEKKPKKNSENPDEIPRNEDHGKSHDDFAQGLQMTGEMIRHLGEAIKQQVDKAKYTGEKVANQLMPIYDKWQKVYCAVEKKVSQKSFSEIWDSLGKIVDQDKFSTEDGERFFDDADDESGLDWHWAFYQNATDLFLPVLEIPGKLELPAWTVVDWKNECAEPPPNSKESNIEEEESLKKEVSDESSMTDPQWFAHMFKAREDLRKDWGEATLSEEEFDWFLQMFEAREDLRRSGEYPSGYHSNDFQNDQDMDWFLKMFEERARLRFQNSEDEKNWYLKMFEARDKARSEVKYQRSGVSNWYAKMFKAREKMRGQQDDAAGWYHKMAIERKKAREAYKYDGPSEDWCQE